MEKLESRVSTDAPSPMCSWDAEDMIGVLRQMEARPVAERQAIRRALNVFDDVRTAAVEQLYSELAGIGVPWPSDEFVEIYVRLLEIAVDGTTVEPGA